MITVTTVLLLISILSSSCESRTITAQRSVVDYGSNPHAIIPVVSLVCITDAPVDAPIRWRFGDTVYASKMGRVHVDVYQDITNTTNTAILIQNLSYSDNGTYTCEVRDEANSTWISDTIHLNLLIYLDPGSNVDIYDNTTSTELTCDMAGYAPDDSALQWYRDNMLMETSTKYTFDKREGTRHANRGLRMNSTVTVLMISEPDTSDNGKYECRVQGHDELTRTVRLTVRQANNSTPTTGSINNNLLTIIIAAVAGVLGIIVIILIVIIIIVICQRCRQRVIIEESVPTTIPLVPTSSHAQKYTPHNTAPSNGDAPPVPNRIPAAHHVPDHDNRNRDHMPDILQSQRQTYDVPSPHHIPQFDPYHNETPPTGPSPHQPPALPQRKNKRTYYDQVNLLKKDTGSLPGASGFSLATVPSPHDILSGSLQRENQPDFSYPIYQDGFSPEDLEPYDSKDHDYDQIYSEPIAPEAMLTDTKGEGMDDGFPYSAIYDDPRPLSTSETPLEISKDNIIEIKKLGNGQFGQVILARTRNVSLVDLKLSETNSDKSHSILVAVKTLKSDAETGLFQAFDKEVKFMSRLMHDNVVRLLAVCHGPESFIVMEYMENGDLNQFLQKHRLVPDTVTGLGEWEITPIILLYIGVQISSGMHYLGSRRFVHRDLATRNCLVGKDFIVKISDFGMSRRLYESAYYRVQGTLVLPIRWMACETFYGKFSVKSDTWAFGVTLWEVYTLASCDPYDDMSDEDVIQDAIRGPNRKLLPKPEICPRDVYDVMLRCWVHDPAMRADFGEIYSRLYMTYTNQAL